MEQKGKVWFITTNCHLTIFLFTVFCSVALIEHLNITIFLVNWQHDSSEDSCTATEILISIITEDCI